MTAPKEQLFLSCSDKTCCERDRVFLSDAETRRLADLLAVAPTAFTEDGALAHKPSGGCVFLLRLPDGAGRCGLGAHRPLPCRAFPSVLEDGVVKVAGTTCTCRAWSLADVDPVADRALLEQA